MAHKQHVLIISYAPGSTPEVIPTALLNLDHARLYFPALILRKLLLLIHLIYQVILFLCYFLHNQYSCHPWRLSYIIRKFFGKFSVLRRSCYAIIGLSIAVRYSQTGSVKKRKTGELSVTNNHCRRQPRYSCPLPTRPDPA